MRINGKFFISMDRKTKAIKTNLFSASKGHTYPKVYETIDTDYYSLTKIIQVCRKRSYTIEFKNKQLARWIKAAHPTLTEDEINERLFDVAKTAPSTGTSTTSTWGPTTTTSSDSDKHAYKNLATDIADKLIKFFTEFNFTPSFRFINTLAKVKDRQAYTTNYFNLQNHSFAKEIAEKVQSIEFKEICNKLNNLCSNVELATINSRFDLYFGEPGTGKTMSATSIGETCIVCSSDMLPTDLMQNFAFSDGKAEFQKSDLWKAMEEGKTIVLDEINMLPFESLRFLQGILDNKSSIDFKGFHIDINENFKVIGTMNLNVNGQCIPLPAPLVDRCASIKEYKMNASMLASALIA